MWSCSQRRSKEEIFNMSNEIIYQSSGQEVKLSPSIVQQFITKGSGKLTTSEVVNFMQLCKYSGLNPFLNEAYIIKFGDKPAQLITSKEAFMKRAERQSTYGGSNAGVVVYNKEKGLEEREGTIVLPDEQLIGGWAKVYRTDRKEPTYVSVQLSEFIKRKSDGTVQSIWKSMPATMIRKAALVNALREAYPDQLSALYTEDEPTYNEDIQRKDVTPSSSENKAAALVDQLKQEQKEEVSEEALSDPEESYEPETMEEWLEQNPSEEDYEQVDLKLMAQKE